MALIIRLVIICTIIFGIFGIFLLLQRKKSGNEAAFLDRRLNFSNFLLIIAGIMTLCLFALAATEYITRL